MKIEVQLSVNAPALYQLLIQSAKHDIKTIHPEVEDEAIQVGYTYEKSMRTRLGMDSATRLSLSSLDENKRYAYVVASGKGSYEVSYTLDSNADGVLVTYEESFDSDAKMQSWNYKLMSALYKRKSKKRMTAMLRQMEAFILEGGNLHA
ncbi:MAG: DUF3284 domain-containing protein [Erysipelotrichaceae bacterium]